MEVDGKNQHERAVKFDFHTGRWTDEEHRKFLDAYEAMIAVDPARRRWPNVAAAVGTRSTTQCRSHALCGNQNSRRVRAVFFASTG